MHKFFRILTNRFSRNSQEPPQLKRSKTYVDVEKLYNELIDLNWMSKQYKTLILDKEALGNHFKSGVDPNPHFDSDWYLRENKDLSDSDIDPLMHYVTFGENEGRKPNPLFDPVTYLQKNPELRNFQGPLLAHFINFGIKQRKTSAIVDNTFEFESARELALLNLEKYAGLFTAQKIAVVIPVYNNWQYTERCIRAIEKTLDYEILQVYVVNDGSTDETLQELERYPNVQIINNPVNSGYLKVCNFAFTQLADYEFLFLLNNDSEPNSGFVVNAMEVMQSNPDAAIVGSTLFSVDGKLQAAGGMVGSDGTCRHWGDLDSEKSSKYRYSRQIDYVPFAAVLIRNSCLKEVNGFDERYIPAYYEDVDLAFQMRQIGKSVYVSSESTVFHFGSKSYGLGGLDSLIGMNLTNKKKFLEKWRLTLKSDPFRQSRKPLCPAIQEYDRTILWNAFNIESAAVSESALELLRTSMRQGYRVIYQCKEYESTNLSLARFRNNGIQVVSDISEVAIEDYLCPEASFANTWKSHSTKLVYEQFKNEVYFEAENADLQSERIAVLAQWSMDEYLSFSTEKLIQEFLNCGYEIVLISACESKESLVLSSSLRDRITILRKPNFGYDFGSWSIALQAFPEIRLANEVILANDSLIGPFSNLERLLDEMKSSPFDITGLTDSLAFEHHIQSYMMHFKNGSLSDDAIWSFWRNIKHHDNKESVIQAYELGLSRLAFENDIYFGALFPFNITPDREGASSKSNALSLIENGFPFVKFNVFHQLDPTKAKELKELVGQRFELAAHELEEFFPASDD